MGFYMKLRQLILKVMECELTKETWQGAKDFGIWQARQDLCLSTAQTDAYRRWKKPFTATRCKATTRARQAAGLPNTWAEDWQGHHWAWTWGARKTLSALGFIEPLLWDSWRDYWAHREVATSRKPHRLKKQKKKWQDLAIYKPTGKGTTTTKYTCKTPRSVFPQTH